MKARRTLASLAVVAAAVVIAVRSGTPSNHDIAMTHSTVTAAVPTESLAQDVVDLAFVPNHITVPKGSTVRFVFHNRGAIVHEAVHRRHRNPRRTRQEAGSHRRHGPRAQGQRRLGSARQDRPPRLPFNRTGTVLIGCHEPGHYTAGMKATMTVS